ncbi:MAG: Phosphoribosylaminoimidazole carboxylase ATPase subunit, partial [Candidatus Eremiobacteraeota bacterium]|nr:Phosphoribosylaminoimidazole carboxylase ATPase subunit [Candidatus Eremiobacteraeota bacterium]
MIRTIGILGGGQLGRMLTLEAKRMGYRVVTLEPFPDSPTGQIADEQIVAAYDDLRAIGELGARCDIVTYEFENIPLESVLALEADRRIVHPGSAALRITQERILEKTFVRDCGIPTADFAPVRSLAELDAAESVIGYPGVLKTTMGGYDGKGQWVVRSRADAERAWAEARGRALIWERLIAFDRELSIIAARNAQGEIVAFPTSENEHDHGVLATTIVPGRIPPAIAERARQYATTIAERLEIIGTFCVEFFQSGDELLVNEIAPRVHNSGHYSLDATSISQYEAHVRAICGLPLVEPLQFMPAVMVNVLGAGAGDTLGGIEDLLREPLLKLHV